MAKTQIYRKDGNPVYQEGHEGEEAYKVYADSLEYSGADMAERFLSVVVKAPYPINFAVGDYITYRGEKFSIFGDGGVVKCARSGSYGEGFSYDNLKFCWSGQELVENEFLDLVLLDNQVHYTCMPEFSFFCENVDDLLDRLQANMDALQFPVKYLTFASDETLDDNFDYRFVYNAERAFLYTAKTGNSVTALIFRTSEWILKYTLSNGVFVRSGSAPVAYSAANWNTATSGYSSVTLYRLNGRWKFFSPSKIRSIQRGVTEEEWNAYYPLPQGETYQEPVYEIRRKNVTISSQNCWGALTLVKSDFNLYFFVQGKDVVIGADRAALSQNFVYGKDNGLYQIGRSVDDGAAVITRLHGYGTEQNVASRYYNHKAMFPWAKIENKKYIDFTISGTKWQTFTLYTENRLVAEKPLNRLDRNYFDNVSELNNDTTRGQQLPKVYPWVGMYHSYICPVKIAASKEACMQGQVYDAYVGFNICCHNTDAVYIGEHGGDKNYYDVESTHGNQAGKDYYGISGAGFGVVMPDCLYMLYSDYQALGVSSLTNIYFAEGTNKDVWNILTKDGVTYRGFDMATQNNEMAVSKLMLPGFPLETLRNWVLNHLDAERGDVVNADGSITWNGITAFFSDEIDNPYLDSINKDAIGLRPYSTIFDGNDNKKDVHPTIEEITIGDLLDAGLLVSNPYYQQNRTTRVDKVFEAGEPITDTGIVDADGYTNDEATNEKIKAKETFELTLYPLGFDLKKYIEASGANATISFTDGMLSGREFEIKSAQVVMKSVEVFDEPLGYYMSIPCWKITCARKTDDTLGIYFPKYGYNVSANDKFVLLGINLPDAYVDVASVKLLKESLKYLNENEHTKYLYEPKIDEIFMARQRQSAIANETPSLYDTIKEGQLFSFTDTDLGLDITMPINTLSIKENGNNGIPTFEITLKDDIEATQVTRSGQASSAGEPVNIDGGMTYPQVKSLIEDWVTPRFLSKFGDDTANGVIGFVKGLWVKAKGLFGISEDGDARVKSINVNDDYGIEEDGDARVNDFEAIGSAIIGGNVTIDGILQAFAKVLTNKIESENWTGDGAFDTGFRLQKGTDGVTSMVVDNLFVRMKAIFTELEIRKISYAGGNIIFSHAGSKIVKVKPIYSEYYLYIPDGTYDERHEGINLDNGIYLPADEGLDLETAYLVPTDNAVITAYRCYIMKDDGTTATENWWRVDDQARCQTFNVVEPGHYENVENTFYWRRVVEVGTELLEDGKTYDYIDLSATDRWVPTQENQGVLDGKDLSDTTMYESIPKAGDQLVQMGNRTDSTRQGFISIEVSGEDAPAFKVYKNVSGYVLDSTKRKICLSPSLTDLHVQKLTIETDYGVSARVPVERGAWSSITDHKCYYYDLVQHNGGTWLCIVAEGSYTTDEPSENSGAWRVYAQKGIDGVDGKSFSILGSYDTYAELIAAHPTGDVGDAYMVGGDLYVWDAENNEWHNSGQIKGEDGNNYVSVYTLADSQPASPYGSSVPPTGWFTNIPQLNSVSAAGDFSEDNGWRKASGNHVANAFIKDTLTFTTTQPNQKVFIQIRPSSENIYDIIAVGLLDTDLANRAAVNALDASRKTSGTTPKTVVTTIAIAGQHTLCIAYSKDESDNEGEDSAWYRVAPVDVYISTAAFKDTTIQGTWSTPTRFSANSEDSVSVLLSPGTLLVNQDMEDLDNLSDLSEDVFVSVYKGAVPQVITNITKTGTTHCNASVGSNYVRLTAVLTDANNKYYDNGNIAFNVTFRDSDTGELKTITGVIIRFNANLLGSWSQKVEGDMETIIAQKTTYTVDGNTYTVQKDLGTFVKSSSENISKLTSQMNNGKNLLSGVLTGTGWKSASSNTPTSAHDISVDSDGWFDVYSGDTYMISPTFSMGNGQKYTFSYEQGSISNNRVYLKYLDTSRNTWVEVANQMTSGSSLRKSVTFEGSSEVVGKDLYIFIYRTQNNTKIIRPQLELGEVASTFDAGTTETTSEIKQTASEINLSVRGDVAGTNINLLYGVDGYTSSNKLVHKMKAADGVIEYRGDNGHPHIFSSVQLVKGCIYTIQCVTDGNIASSHSTSGTPSSRLCTIWLRMDGTLNGGYNGECFTSQYSGYENLGDGRHKWTFVCQKTGEYWFRTNSYSDGTTEVTINFWNIKLEGGSSATAFTASTSQMASQINQTANSIELNVKNGLEEVGISILGDSNKVVAKAGTFEVQNNSGTKTFEIDSDGNLQGSGNAAFKGTIKSGQYTENGQTKYANQINDNGSGQLAKGEISWDANGNAEYTGVLKAPMVYSPSYECDGTVYAITDVKARTFIHSYGGDSTVFLPKASDYQGLEIQFFAPLLTRTYVGDLYVKCQRSTILIPDENDIYASAAYGVKIGGNNLVTFKAINQDWFLISGKVTVLTS